MSNLQSVKFMRIGIGIAIAAVVALGIWGLTKVPSGSNGSDITKACIGGPLKMHIHPHLTIIVNGERRLIPDDLGVSPGCHHYIHRHPEDDKIHVESPVLRNFTVGEIFQTWGQPFSRDQVLDVRTDATHEIIMTVNGRQADTYENTVMRDNDEIVIEYREKI